MKQFQRIVFIMNFFWLGALSVFSYRTLDNAVPDHLYCVKGEEPDTEFGVPVTVERSSESREVLWNVRGQENGYTLECSFLGILPLKEITVELVEEEGELYASGMPVGIYVKTNGVLAVDTGTVKTVMGTEQSPCENLILGGDYICSVDGQDIPGKDALVDYVNSSGGKTMELLVLRKGEETKIAVTPVKAEDGEYRLGIWIRDDMAGVGTLTYVTEDLDYAALGHGINDSDTSSQILMKQGELYQTSIVGIVKGTGGVPGELSGIINYTGNYRLGTITENTDHGIFGKLDSLSDKLAGERYPVGYKQEITEGMAYIVSGITGERTSYMINITQVNYNSKEEHKSILFEVTDPTLLELTGGIIQGMSGAPIIQNGKIIGAVTHVFVNDPKKGYGIFIEDMLAKAY